MPNYEVTVGNIGRVHLTGDFKAAIKTFNEYAKQSHDQVGRAAGEEVSLFKDGELIKNYAPLATPSQYERNVREFLEMNGNRSEFRGVAFEDMTEYQKLDACLHWNGLVGWTNFIIGAVEEFFGVKLHRP